MFVESPNDAEIYQSAYDALKQYLRSELSINFIATGVESSNGQHVNTGCAVVKKIVSDLRLADAKHVLGLLDWDGKNKTGDGIVVLAEGERDGLESVLFDPLLILNALIRNRASNAIQGNLPAATTYTSLVNLPTAALQVAIDELQRLVMGHLRCESISVKYIGGFELLVDKDYVCMDDHQLERKLYESFPALQEIARNRVGNLAKWIAQVLIPDRPEHVPTCLLTTFLQILDS